MNTTRSPLRSRPHRVPGQSVDEHLHDRLINDILVPIILAAMLVALAVIEWVRMLRPSPPQPWLLTGFALLGLGYAVLRIWRSVPKLRALKLARDGERAVAEVLERLRESGYRVFHDIIGDGFNIDHVIIGPHGIYTIETKTYSKPRTGKPIVTFNGEHLIVNGHTPDRNAVSQARSQASFIRSVLRESTGRDVRVRPVVVYPGWFVARDAGVRSDVWALNPKALESFLVHEPELLSAEDQHLFSFHLSRFVRKG